jgi:hypothetical protein
MAFRMSEMGNMLTDGGGTSRILNRPAPQTIPEHNGTPLKIVSISCS